MFAQAKLKLLVSMLFAALLSALVGTDIMLTYFSILFGVLTFMFYLSLSMFDTFSADTHVRMYAEILQEIHQLQLKIYSEDAIPKEQQEQVTKIIQIMSEHFIEDVLSLEFLSTNTYSVADSLDAVQYLSRRNIAKVENAFTQAGYSVLETRKFRQLTEEDRARFFDSVSRIIKSEPFLYRRQQSFKKALRNLMKDYVYDYFLFVEKTQTRYKEVGC